MPGAAPLTFPQLEAALDGASPATSFCYLRGVPDLRSYNHGGRFYTHADPRRFDHFGLFRLDSACFSHDGSLTATVTRLVQEAEAGWTHEELLSPTERSPVRSLTPATPSACNHSSGP